MAQLVAFHYQPRDTPVHHVDTRFKLPLFLLVVAVILRSGPVGLALLSASLAAGIALARLPIARIGRELRLFALLLLLMFVARSVGQGGTGHFLFDPAAVFRRGALAAGILVWRLSLLLLYGTLLATTTRTSHLQAAVAWFLKPFPFLPGARIATMVGLTISLIPLIFDSYNEISDAQRARCIQGVGNPLRRLRRLAVPLILKTFGRADTLASAIESRCYNDARSFAPLVSRHSDWFAVFLVLAITAASFAADRIV
jgi:energy-coupling factor transporter transmembrane protein EcfT